MNINIRTFFRIIALSFHFKTFHFLGQKTIFTTRKIKDHGI